MITMLSREYLYVYPYKYQDRFNRMYKDNQDVVRRFLSQETTEQSMRPKLS